MKLTKDIISVLKYQGFMTSTAEADTFLKAFDTVEELGEAGFIGDRGAIDFLKSIFNEDGVNMTGPTTEEDVQDVEPVVEPTPIEPEPVVKPVDPAIVEPGDTTQEEKDPELTPEPVDETPIEPEIAVTPEPNPEPVVEPEAKPKKTTKKKKTDE